MILTPEQQALLDGEKGETMAKVVKTLVMYGNAFDAQRMVPVTSEYGHTVISFGLKTLGPVYDLYQKLLDEGLLSQQKFTADPRPLDKNVPSSFLEDIVFNKLMYSRQASYEKQLEEMGLLDEDSYTCTSYLPQVGNIPKQGDILSWAESSAVIYANSVLGARCNRNSGILEVMGSVAGFVPEFGLLTDEGRKAHWIVEVRCEHKPEAQLLGSAIGLKVMEDVPYVKGLDKWLGTELTDEATTYLKDFGAACASNVDDAELQRVKDSYPVIWKDPDAKPALCFVGCPHMTLKQLEDWTDNVTRQLEENGRTKVTVPTVFTASTPVIKEFEKTERAGKLADAGVVVSYICPLMYMNNPLCKKKPVITSSNKLRTYTSSRYYTEAEILDIITGKESSQ